MRGVALLESGLHDPHSDILHYRRRGGDRRRARAHARHHERVPTHEPLVHQILGLLPHVREQHRPVHGGLLLTRHCVLLRSTHQNLANKTRSEPQPTPWKALVLSLGLRVANNGGRSLG